MRACRTQSPTLVETLLQRASVWSIRFLSPPSGRNSASARSISHWHSALASPRSETGSRVAVRLAVLRGPCSWS